jgi:hypothetical protein
MGSLGISTTTVANHVLDAVKEVSFGRSPRLSKVKNGSAGLGRYPRT